MLTFAAVRRTLAIGALETAGIADLGSGDPMGAVGAFAGFALLAAMGRAQAKDLGLEGGPLYNPVANYDRVRHRISDFGDDGEPDRVATSTVGTPVQDASVPPVQDPALQTDVDTNPQLTTGANAPSRR